MQITRQQVERIAHECMRQGIKQGNLISSPPTRSKQIVEEILDETPVSDGPQWWVVSHGSAAELTAKGFGQDLKAAHDFMEQVQYNFWALVHRVDWVGAPRGQIDRSPQSVRKAA